MASWAATLPRTTQGMVRIHGRRDVQRLAGATAADATCATGSATVSSDTAQAATLPPEPPMTPSPLSPHPEPPPPSPPPPSPPPFHRRALRHRRAHRPSHHRCHPWTRCTIRRRRHHRAHHLSHRRVPVAHLAIAPPPFPPPLASHVHVAGGRGRRVRPSCTFHRLRAHHSHRCDRRTRQASACLTICTRGRLPHRRRPGRGQPAGA